MLTDTLWSSGVLRSIEEVTSMKKLPEDIDVGDATLRLVVLNSARKWAEQAMGSKSVISTPPWSLHQLLLPGPCPVQVPINRDVEAYGQ